MLSPVEEIKSRVDIVELVRSYVKLQKAGVNFKANCPFHAERTPSFFVTPARQIWHCFGGCGKGGDIFKFIMEIEGCDFPDALKLLAHRAGVALKQEDPSARSERNRLYDLCEQAARLFEHTLSLAPAVRAYMRARGMSEETVKNFRIGYAPESWDFLLRELIQKDFRKEDIEKAGLAVKSQDGSSWYDRFRSRIIFPITDANNRVIGFGGRIFTPEAKVQGQEARVEAKYINTPQTPIYDKSRALYGFDKAKQDIRVQNRVVVVEGYMDCVMSHQAGVKNTVAVSGTALTAQQLTLLKRLCDVMVSSFDADAAGESATRRSLALAGKFEFERLVIHIPSGKDPADMVLESPEMWRTAVAGAQPMLEFYFEKMFREHDPKTAAGRKSILVVLLALLGEVASEIEQAHWVRELARRLDIPEEAVTKEINRKKDRKSGELLRSVIGYSDDSSRTAESPGRRELLEERLLCLLSVLPEDTRLRIGQNRHILFASMKNRALFQALTNLDQPGDPAQAGEIELLKFKGETYAERSAMNSEQEFVVCRREFEKECLKERLMRLGGEIHQREKEGNHLVVTSLLQDFRMVSEELKSLSA